MQSKNTIYPLQDKILKSIDELKTPFYLTGGTALARCYFNHRYSDDLDLFVHQDERFKENVKEILMKLGSLDFRVITKDKDFYSITVSGKVKVDFVNDVGEHRGDFKKCKLFSRVDNVHKILANKISAIVGRDDPKDVVDVWVIWKEVKVEWKEVFRDVKSKALGIYPPSIGERLEKFPKDWIDDIKWVDGKKPNKTEFEKELEQIVEEILALK